MAFYKKSKLHTGTALICSLAIVFSALPVYATDTIDNLQNQTSALENELKGINQDILTLSEKISDTEMQVEILNSDIDKTQDDLEKAQKNEDQQYEDMKSRIKYMYEHGSATMLEMLFSAENMSDFLNKADFIENLSNYDRKALNDLKDVHQQIADQKADLEAQQASMKDLQNQLQTQQTQLQAKAAATSTNLNEVNAKLQKAKEEEAARQAEEARKQGFGHMAFLPLQKPKQLQKLRLLPVRTSRTVPVLVVTVLLTVPPEVQVLLVAPIVPDLPLRLMTLHFLQQSCNVRPTMITTLCLQLLQSL